MVLANLATLLDVSPRELTDWFWVAYTDAYDWVVEPNVLGMGTYAVGDLMTTKPYVSGAAYIARMSDYCEAAPSTPRPPVRSRASTGRFSRGTRCGCAIILDSGCRSRLCGSGPQRGERRTPGRFNTFATRLRREARSRRNPLEGRGRGRADMERIDGATSGYGGRGREPPPGQSARPVGNGADPALLPAAFRVNLLPRERKGFTPSQPSRPRLSGAPVRLSGNGCRGVGILRALLARGARRCRCPQATLRCLRGRAGRRGGDVWTGRLAGGVHARH